MVILMFLIIPSIGSPLPLCLLLVGLSGVIALIRGLSVSKWIFCSIFLIFLGGMIVIFLYVCSISINEKLTWSTRPYLYLIPIIAFFGINVLSEKSNQGLWEVYSYSWSPLIIFFIFYLLVALVLAVKFSQSFKGALVKNW